MSKVANAYNARTGRRYSDEEINNRKKLVRQVDLREAINLAIEAAKNKNGVVYNLDHGGSVAASYRGYPETDAVVTVAWPNGSYIQWFAADRISAKAGGGTDRRVFRAAVGEKFASCVDGRCSQANQKAAEKAFLKFARMELTKIAREKGIK